MKRRGCTYVSEAVREMLGLPRLTARTAAIPLLDQLELESPAITRGFVDLVERHDQMRVLLTRIGRHVGLPKEATEIPPIGDILTEPRPERVRPEPEPPPLPPGFVR